MDTPLYASPDGSVTIICELAAHLRELPGLEATLKPAHGAGLSAWRDSV
ncbi:MAG TPA: hypothetical protein VN759_04515 [Pseudolysinimonas sp.]|nr:hypothetical protein [Pseudolysinimonas sp.]